MSGVTLDRRSSGLDFRIRRGEGTKALPARCASRAGMRVAAGREQSLRGCGAASAGSQGARCREGIGVGSASRLGAASAWITGSFAHSAHRQAVEIGVVRHRLDTDLRGSTSLQGNGCLSVCPDLGRASTARGAAPGIKSPMDREKDRNETGAACVRDDPGERTAHEPQAQANASACGLPGPAETSSEVGLLKGQSRGTRSPLALPLRPGEGGSGRSSPRTR